MSASVSERNKLYAAFQITAARPQWKQPCFGRPADGARRALSFWGKIYLPWRFEARRGREYQSILDAHSDVLLIYSSALPKHAAVYPAACFWERFLCNPGCRDREPLLILYYGHFVLRCRVYVDPPDRLAYVRPHGQIGEDPDYAAIVRKRRLLPSLQRLGEKCPRY
jgi:hypothetical protein